jgi:polysaccharide biosynthesis transport protein
LSFLKTIKDKIKTVLKDSTSSESGTVSAIPSEKPSEADIIAEALRDSITVTAVKESRLINISFQSEHPDFSRIVANTIADAYKEEVMAMQMDASSYALKWMTQKADEERGNLARAEKALQQYMKQNDIVTVEDKVTILPQQLSQLTSKLAEAEAQKNVVANVYRQIEEVRDSKRDIESLPTLANHKGLQDIRENIRKAEQEVSELRQKFGPKHPTMIEARTKLGDIVRQKNAEISKIIASVKNEYEVARAQEASLRSALAGIKGETQNLNEKLTEYNILKREVDTNRALYDALVMQAKEKGATENTQKVNVWKTQVAQTPDAPVKPKPMRNILFGLVLGLFGGVGCAFFIEYLDDTVKDPEEAERRYEISVIGVIELLKKGRNPDRFVREEPTSSFAESYKSLRTTVLLASADRPPKRLMVTSMSPQEGKTTTAINLARSLGQTDRRVLLVDADLRRPQLHKAFQLQNLVGLSSCLAGSVKDIPVQSTGETGLFVLTSGPIPPNPSELLGSPRFFQMLELLERQFDMILIDSPPILSATDGLLISKLAESVIVVCLASKTTHDRLNRGLKSLREINTNILGLVLNAMDMKKSNYYSQYGYYQYYAADKEQ